MRAKFHQECPIGNLKMLGKCWRTRRIIFNTVQKTKQLHPTGSENTPIPHFEIKITEILQEKLSANPNVPLLVIMGMTFADFRLQNADFLTRHILKYSHFH